MNKYFLSAAVVAFLVGLAHSVLGEILIFQKLRRGGVVPTNGGQLLRESNVRILWASWHILTVFGWAIAAALAYVALLEFREPASNVIVLGIAVAMAVGAGLVALGTKWRHPGWIGLLMVAVLVGLGQGA